MTYELLLEDTLNNAPDGIDTRPGSIYYDAISGILMKVARLYTDLDLVFQLMQIDSATGEYLDLRASEYGIYRQAATAAQYNVSFEGVTPDIGERFFSDGLYFRLREADNGELYLEAEETGIGGNDIFDGTAAVPVNNIAGLTSATFTGIREYGTDDEDDESLRQRVKEKIAGPAENGNKQHYKTWCESIEGVGLARITPLWNGPNTVKAILISPLGLPCSARIVEEVQTYIDPATKGYTTVVDGRTYVVGDGLGEGIANLGAHFTAAAADELKINITLDVELASGTTADSASEAVQTAVAEYFKDLVLSTTVASDLVVRYTAVGAIISSLSMILDYHNLQINGGTDNVHLGEDDVPVLGEVVLNAL
jgi:uncharacterized phage protein gp47/JayE